MKTTAIAVLALIVSAVACGPRETEVVRIVDHVTPAEALWEGESRERLEAILGRPSTVKRDGHGGQIYTYEELEVVGYQPPEEPSGFRALHPTGLVVTQRTLAVFWIDTEGVVYREWYKPGLKKLIRRRLAPPRR